MASTSIATPAALSADASPFGPVPPALLNPSRPSRSPPTARAVPSNPASLRPPLGATAPRPSVVQPHYVTSHPSAARCPPPPAASHLSSAEQSRSPAAPPSRGALYLWLRLRRGRPSCSACPSVVTRPPSPCNIRLWTAFGCRTSSISGQPSTPGRAFVSGRPPALVGSPVSGPPDRRPPVRVDDGASLLAAKEDKDIM